MIRRVVAFDLDNTLAASKSPITGEMAGLLERLLARFQVCVISGGKFEQFEAQLIDHLNVAPDKLGALQVMPTCGTRYYRFDVATGAFAPYQRNKGRVAFPPNYDSHSACARLGARA